MRDEGGEAEGEEVEPRLEYDTLGLKCGEDFGQCCFTMGMKDKRRRRKRRENIVNDFTAERKRFPKRNYNVIFQRRSKLGVVLGLPNADS